MKQQDAIFPENRQVVDLYSELTGTAEQREGKRKVNIYLRPTEIESLLRMRKIPTTEWAEVLTQLFSMQDIANHFRLTKKKG